MGRASDHAFEPLFAPDAAAIGVESPWIAYGTDRPDALAIYGRHEFSGPDLDALAVTARQNLAAQAVRTRETVIAGMDVVAVDQIYYAAEKLLDAAFMADMRPASG
ncbi:MAG: hypothetical protein AAF721_09100 [Myxococcota bacterium]